MHMRRAGHGSAPPLNCGVRRLLNVIDTGGHAWLPSKTHLAERLASQRIGSFGAFFLWSQTDYPRLAVHFNGGLAYVHYFPHPGHAGYAAIGGTSDQCPATVEFIQPPETSADNFALPRELIVSAETAHAIAYDFFDDGARSTVVEWLEL